MVLDYDRNAPMLNRMDKKPADTISISEFKATCLAVLERVRRTGASIVVTKRGVPVAEINPPSLARTGEGWLGSMRGTATLADDLIEPASTSGEWDAFTT
jgi:prevent-host-death family protein